MKESFLNPVFIICRKIENVMADSALSTFTTWKSRAFASRSRVNMAGLPDRLSIYGIPEEHNTIRHCIPLTSYKASCQNHSLGAGGLSWLKQVRYVCSEIRLHLACKCKYIYKHENIYYITNASTVSHRDILNYVLGLLELWSGMIIWFGRYSIKLTKS